MQNEFDKMAGRALKAKEITFLNETINQLKEINVTASPKPQGV